MILDKIVFQSTPPSQTNILWAKPVTGGFTIYAFNRGSWQPMKAIDGKGTPSTDDDTIISGGGGSISDTDREEILNKINALENATEIATEEEVKALFN